MSSTLMTSLVSALIAGELVLFAILRLAERTGMRPCPGWFYFLLCVGLFGMAGTSFLAYVDTFRKLRELDVVGVRVLAAGDLLGTLKDMESGHRGFLLTGRGSYLEPYRRGLASLPGMCRQLKGAYHDSDQLPRVENVCRLAEAKVKEMGTTIDLRERRRPEDALAQFNTDVGKNTMDLLRIAAGELNREDRARYDAIKAELIVIAEGRIAMALLVAIGAVVQMILGAFAARRPAEPIASW